MSNKESPDLRNQLESAPLLTKDIVLEEIDLLASENKSGRPILTMADDSEVGNWFLYFIPTQLESGFIFEIEPPTKVNVQIHIEDGSTLGMIDFGKTKQVCQLTKKLEQLGLRSAMLFRVHMQPALHRWLNVSSTSGPPLRNYKCTIHEYYAEGVRHRCDWVSFSGSHPSHERPSTKIELPPVQETARVVEKKRKTETDHDIVPSVITTRMMGEFLPRRSIVATDVVVYIDGIFDLSNLNHVLLLRKARELGTYLIVGIHNSGDRNITAQVLTLSACRFVDDIVMGPPTVIDDNLIRSLGIHIIAKTNHTDVSSPLTVPVKIVTTF
jgi:hypothetical protein